MKDKEVLKKIITERRSCRSFSKKKVNRKTLKKVIETASWAPSSCNRQNWYFVAVDDPKIKEKVSKLADVRQHYLYKAPVILLVFYDTVQEQRYDQKAPLITSGTIIQNILLILHSYGLGGIFLAGIKNFDGLNVSVNVPNFFTPIGIICIGYPEKFGNYPPPPRKKVNEILSFNKCSIKIPNYEKDINPRKWSFEQFSKFRGHILWYKGFDIDNRYMHVEPIPATHKVSRFYYTLFGKLIGEFKEKVDIFDFLSYGGEGLINIEMQSFSRIKNIYSYEINEIIEKFIKARLSNLYKRKDYRIFKFIRNKKINKVSINIKRNSMNIISCFFRLEQFHDKENILKEFKKILKNKGHVLILTTNPIIQKKENMQWNRGPEESLEYKDYLVLFKKVGFRVNKAIGLEPEENRYKKKCFKYLSILRIDKIITGIENIFKTEQISFGKNMNSYRHFIFDLIKE